MTGALLATFGAGLLASLSPCVYPLLPITLGFLGTQAGASGAGRARNVLCYALGQVLAFVAVGALAVAAGETLGFTSESRAANAFVGVLLLGGAAVVFAGELPVRLRPRFSRKTFSQPKSATLLGAFALGAGSALVASPCTSPLLAGVLGMLASSATLGRGVVLMLVYSLGFSSLFLALGLGLIRVGRIPRSGRWMILLQRIGACAMAGGGVFYLARALF